MCHFLGVSRCCLFVHWVIGLALLAWLLPANAATEPWVVLNDDGGWCWFEDPRVAAALLDV